MKQLPLTAARLRLVLSISLFLVVILASTGFYLVDRMLKEVALDVSRTLVDANASQSNIQTLQKVQKDLSDNQDIVERASSIVADSQSYQYQDQIITDLNDYAQQSGVAITNLDFSGSTEGSSVNTPPAALKTPQTTVPVPKGVKSTAVSVTLKNPVKYNDLLRFIKSIEQNLTKMQISKVSLSKDTANSGVSSEAFTIEVYIK